jgi:hypothetical protein
MLLADGFARRGRQRLFTQADQCRRRAGESDRAARRESSSERKGPSCRSISACQPSARSSLTRSTSRAAVRLWRRYSRPNRGRVEFVEEAHKHCKADGGDRPRSENSCSRRESELRWLGQDPLPWSLAMDLQSKSPTHLFTRSASTGTGIANHKHCRTARFSVWQSTSRSLSCSGV